MGDEPNAERRSRRSHQAVLDATVELLEEAGYRNLTIEGVAKRAGVGKQTIYRWWHGSKPALVLEAFTHASDERVEPPDIGDVRRDLLAILEPVFHLQADLRTGTALANKTLMAEAQLDPDFHPSYVDLHRYWWGPIRAALERGIERGQIRSSCDVGLVVDALLGAAWYRLLLEHAPLDTNTATSLVDMILDGVRSPTKRARR